jgi:hypothetical protein
MKKLYFIPVVICSFILLSFVSVKKYDTKITNYKADFVTKRIVESSSMPSNYSERFERVIVSIDENGVITNISSVEGINNTEILNEFIGESVVFTDKRITLTREHTKFDQNILNKQDAAKFLHYYLKIYKNQTVKK